MPGADRGAGLPAAYRVREVVRETSQVRRYVFDGRLPARPGQFVMAWLPGVDEKPFSLMDSDPLTLAVAEVGPFTRALGRLVAGDRLWMRGPFGRGFELRGQRLLLVAGGYGAAPLAFLAGQARRAGKDVTVIVAARTRELLLLADHFAGIGCRVLTCTDDGSDGNRMLADAAAAQALDGQRFDGIYACGPAAMLEAIERLARARHLPAQISREAYMRCGIGVCGSCTCGDQLVCQDGPVFFVE